MSKTLYDIGLRQQNLLDRASQHLELAEKRGFNVATSAFCYLNAWSPCPGNALMKWWRFGLTSLAGLIFEYLKAVVSIARQSNYSISDDSPAPESFSHIIVSWARQSDLLPDGSFQDRYLGANSKDYASVIWIPILLDGQPPVSINNNVRILSRSKGASRFDIVFFLQFFIQKIRESKGSLSCFFYSFSAATAYAEAIAAIIGAQIRGARFDTLLMPYEAQPFQHAAYLAAKKHNKAIRTIGYMHSVLPPLPTDLLYRSGAPDTLWTHGRAQAEILSVKLGWPESTLRIIPSLRYKYSDKVPFSGQIFFPYSFHDPGLLVSGFRALLSKAAPGSLPLFAIRNHPMMSNSASHMQLEARFKALIDHYRKCLLNNSTSTGESIFVGATAAIIEALERGVRPIQICSDPVFEAHTETIWDCLEVIQLDSMLFKYRLRERGSCIQFGGEEDCLRRYLA